MARQANSSYDETGYPWASPSNTAARHAQNNGLLTSRLHQPTGRTDTTTPAGPGESQTIYSEPTTGPAVYIPEPTSNGTPCATTRLENMTLPSVSPVAGFVKL